MKNITVCTPSNHYSIIIDNNIISSLIDNLDAHKKTLLITDSNVALFQKKILEKFKKKNALIHIIPAGEKSKNQQELNIIYTLLLKNKFNRSSLIIAFGGGVIGDIAGYSAATFMRGIHFIQVPSSLLAMVDSSIGGKVAVNHELGKNMIGVFKQPDAVYIDPTVLKTLHHEERHCGMAEIVKHSFIQNFSYFEFLEEHFESIIELKNNVLIETIYQSCIIKKNVVEQDEKDSSIRAILNYGHTLGHALESLTHYHYFKHGQAISYGMLFAGLLSKELLDFHDLDRHNTLINRIQKPLLPKINQEKLFELMLLDKKNADNQITFILLKKIGETLIKKNIPHQQIKLLLKIFLSKITMEV